MLKSVETTLGRYELISVSLRRGTDSEAILWLARPNKANVRMTRASDDEGEVRDLFVVRGGLNLRTVPPVARFSTGQCVENTS